MSGVQDKVVLLKRGVTYQLPLHGSPTNVIFKRERARYPGLVQNELASLQLMERAGVPVAQASAPAGLPGFIESVRYDRVVTGSSITRLHQEDFCQATGHRPRRKYQESGGPSLADLAGVLTRYSAEPLRDLELLARWEVANLCIGNNDGHAKNLSLLYSRAGVQLAPAYDVVCTHVYPFDRKLAIAFGGVYTVEGMTRSVLAKASRSLGLSTALLVRLIEEITTNLEAQVDDICGSVATQYGDTPILTNISNVVRERCVLLRSKISQ